MKIRKLLPILALAVVALVALSGCDNMLAELFNLNPIIAGTNTLTVNVDTYYSSVGKDIYFGDLVVVLVDGNGNVVSTPRRFSLQYYNVDPIQAAAVFKGLKADTYTAYAWIDYNGDSQPTGDWDYDVSWGSTSYYFPTNGGSPGTITASVSHQKGSYTYPHFTY